jgi:hypothetical protein
MNLNLRAMFGMNQFQWYGNSTINQQLLIFIGMNNQPILTISTMSHLLRSNTSTGVSLVKNSNHMFPRQSNGENTMKSLRFNSTPGMSQAAHMSLNSNLHHLLTMSTMNPQLKHLSFMNQLQSNGANTTKHQQNNSIGLMNQQEHTMLNRMNHLHMFNTLHSLKANNHLLLTLLLPQMMMLSAILLQDLPRRHSLRLNLMEQLQPDTSMCKKILMYTIMRTQI